MAKPCIVKYKGKEYSVEQFSAMLHDGLLNNLIESGAIDQNKLKGDLKLLQDKGISFRYTLQEDGVSVILEGTEAINKGANAQTIRTGTRKNNNLKYIDNYSFDDVLNETYNTNSGAVSLAIKLGEGIFNYKKKNKTTGVVSKKSFVIPFLNIEAANKLKKLRKEYKKLNPPESKEEKARKAEDKRLLTKEQLKQKQAENRAKKAEERKLLSKEEKKAIADKNAKDKKRSAKIKEELNQITKQVLVDFHKMMVLNLLAIYDTLDQNFVKLSKDWYLGANRFANAYANKYKLTVEQAAAIIAVLSPQNDWFNNLSVAERVMEIMANYSNTKMTSDIIEKAIKNQTTGEEEKNFVDVLRAAYKKFGEVSIEDLRKMGATEEIQAIYLRAFDHALHSNKVAMTDPTGKFIGFDKTPVRWNSTSEITKAITVYRDSSMVTINDQLGGGSKVRNFYNNIVDPNSPTPYVTSDTHAAAAAMAIPMSANDAGTGFKLFDSGLNPVYAMVKQAYISAADIVELFPREFQSITWEGTRLGINDKNRTEEKKNETFNEVSKLRENPKTNAYENARAIIAINPSGDPIWGESRGIKTQKSTFKDSESIRSDSDKRISQVSNYGQESGRLRGDSTRVGGETTRGKADTGEVSFRFEKSGTATVKNAPKGTYLNIGLLKGETEELISIDDVLSNLPSDVKVIKQRQVTGTEPTLALQINRKMSDQEMEDFRNATAQMAIPQLSDGKGVIHGTQEWGEFNPEYFVLPNNKPLSSIKGVEITSVEPNEEVSVGAEVQSNWNYEGEGDAFASNKDARDGKSSYIIRMLNKGIGSGYYRAKQRGELDTESPLTYKGDKESVSAIDGNGNTVGIIQLQADGGIEHIVVAPEFSRKGIASELIKQIEQKGAKVIPEKSKIISPDAAKLFNKLQSLKAGEQEGPSFRKEDIEEIDLSKIKSKQELIDKLEGKKLVSSIYVGGVYTWIEDFEDEKTGNITSVTRREESKKLIIERNTIITRKDIDKLAQFDFDTDLYGGPNVGVRKVTDLEKLYITRKVKTASAKEVLTAIANDKESKYSELAKELLEKGNSKGLAVPVKLTGKRRGGIYIWETDSIEISSYYEDDQLEEVIIHEIVHGFTHKEIEWDRRTDVINFNYDVKKGSEYLIDLNNYINDDKANPYLKNLIEAYIYAVEQSGLTDKVFGNFNVQGLHKGVPYGFTNLDEFLAETFSNPNFQNMLNEIEMPGTKKTIWQTIVDAIRNILGLSVKQGSVLESALRNGAEIINKARGGVETEEGPSFRLTEDSGVSYEDTIKMAGFEDEAAIGEWQKKNKVKQQQKRNPAVQKAAEEYRKGNINQAEYIQVVRENQPIKPFVMVPKIPSFKEIVASIEEKQVKKGIIGLTKDIPDGALVGLRLDIKAYERYDIWVPTVHDGSNNKEGLAIGYAKTAVIKNVTFKTSAKRSLDIASAKLDSKGEVTGKTTVARILGEWVNEDPQSVKERAEKLMNDPAWTQIGMNPFRHSWFYDKANGNPIISADEVIQVGALVLGKNVVMGSITDEKFETQNEKGEDIYFRKDDKVKGTYFEPAMTTDSKGNYVFFHFSTAPLKSLMKGIDSRKYYSTRTSREEKGLQYGVASYYTKPTDSENVVGGDKYYVTISPDKVYPMDLDPNGYRAAAEKKFKKNTPFRESRISKEIANAAARDGYEMAVGEWSYDRAGLTVSEIPEFRGDALVPLKPQEITGKEKFKTGKERGIKTEHPDKARLAFNQQVEDLASDIDSYKSSKKKYDDAYSIANEVMTYGGIVEDYGTKNERVRPLTREEFNTMTKGLPAKLKERADKLRSQMEDNEGLSFRIDDLWHGTPHKVDKFSTSKIGTGEGAQMFGWGLYFTNLKSIAKGYAKANAKIRFKGESLDDNPIFEKLFLSLDAANDEFYDYSTGAITNLKKFKEYIDDMYQYLKQESNKVIDEYNPRVERFLGEWGGTNYDASILEKRLVLTDEQEKEFEKRVYEVYEANGFSKEEADRALEVRGQSRKAALKSIYQAMKLKATRAERVKNAINFVKNDLKSDLNYYKFLSDNFDKFDLQRNLYKVSLHEGKDPSQYTYLEWYKPISEKIKTALLNFIAQDNKYSHSTWTGLKNKLKYRIENDMINTGEELYNTIAETSGLNPKQASLFLLDAGIDGVKYPAESISRGATDETARGFNYVVFDENAITIEDEISFRFDNTRKLVTELRLKAILKGSNFKDLRSAINVSPTSFYTPQKYAQLKPQIANMSNAELIAAIDVENSLENIINVSDGPIVGLAFIEYINRLKNIVEDPNSTQTDIDDANDLIQSTYERVAPFTTKVAQILRQLGEIKSTIKKDEVQFYLDMIEALIEANGNMINDDHRDALRDIIQILLDSKKNHASLFSNLANKGNNVTDQDIHDLNMAEVEMQNATAALNMLVGFLSPPSTARFWAGVLKGNLMSVRSATVGLLSNILNIGVFRYRNLVQATLSTLILPLKKLGVNTLGLEKYQFFNTPIVSNIKYALFIDVLQDAIVGLTKAIVAAGKIMIGKETRRGFLDKSPIANQVFNIIKYGSSALEGGSPVMIDQSNHIMLSIKNAFTGKGQKTRLDIRGIKMDVANSFKKANFSKWFKANYPGSDYNALSAKDKKIIQNEYFNDPSTMVPTLGDKAGGLGRAFMAFNSEFVFRLVALSDYLPKTYANNVEMTRLAQTLGLDERQTILFMKDPARYIEIVNNLLSPESLKFWTDTVAEVTVTKDTGTGMASVAIVNAIKYYVPQKLLQEFPNLKDNKWFSAVNTAWQLLIDSVVPFVKIPMNFISLVSDFLLPSKPALKVIYFFGLALKNRGTDQADAYALSAIKNVSTAVVACGIRALAVGLVSIPGMVVLAPGKDDDDEKRKMKSKFSRMSINIDALRRYFGGEDPSYKDGDKYEALTAYGLLGMVIYNYASINETADKDYYDKLNSAPRNINPEQLNLGTPFNMKNAGMLELELKAFQSSQFFIDQSWFVGVNGVLEGLTGGETGRDRFFNSFTTTLLSYWWGFSSHAQQISDIYREATGKPVFDLALPANLQDYNNPDYPGDFGDRVWNNIFKKNELVHKYLMEAPDESEYVKFGMYGEPLTPVPGITKNNTEIIMSVAGPMRTARTNLTKEERLYMAVYDNKNKINIPGKTLSLIEPTLKKSEKITVFMTDTDGEKVAKTFNAAVKPSDYNKINKMAGDALRDLHTVLLSEQGLLDYEVRGKVISPEDIMSKNWGNTREVANVRNAIALTFSEGNKLLNTFLKPWEMFGSDTGKYIDKKIVATIQGVKSLVASKISEYEVLNPETGKMEMLTNYLVGHPELESKLYNLALESINLYLKLADESIEQEEEYNKLIDNPEMTIEQEKARKEGNF